MYELFTYNQLLNLGATREWGDCREVEPLLQETRPFTWNVLAEIGRNACESVLRPPNWIQRRGDPRERGREKEIKERKEKEEGKGGEGREMEGEVRGMEMDSLRVGLKPP